MSVPNVVSRSTSAGASMKGAPRSSHVMKPSGRPSLISGTITKEPMPNSRAIASGIGCSAPGSSTKIAAPASRARWKAPKRATGSDAGRAITSSGVSPCPANGTRVDVSGTYRTIPTRSNSKPPATAAQARSSTARARNSPPASARASAWSASSWMCGLLATSIPNRVTAAASLRL